MNIKFNDLLKQFEMYKTEYEQKVISVLNSGWYVLGNEVQQFENEFAEYVGSKYCVGLASGLDALVLAFRALDIKNGDEVIVQANTYIASVMGISMNGATPVFVEPNEYYNIDYEKIEEKITNKTKAILVVHLYGQATNMEKILEICSKYNLFLVEDCAQSHGAKFKGEMTGTFGDVGCFSFYPSKNLGAFGDAGAITTNNKEIAENIKILRNYGSEKRYHNKVVGFNSRLDEIQAGFLRVKLKHLNDLMEERVHIANRYCNEIINTKIKLPLVNRNCTAVWHLFVLCVEDRNDFVEYLNKNEVGNLVHYPIPPHLSEAYKYLGIEKGSFPLTEEYANKVISIPIFNGMNKEEIDYVIHIINKY
ncbi:MAG: DegT/DnrJ/EryC1/StrS family aminotransferase [Sedimentibacter saalensis]|uniref:DegT/DnrJ/EryC1/StrS family aminotransferase n=1 Tax=Sedimentibacter saalensis TaxID=130788 RepID=UPI003158820D